MSRRSSRLQERQYRHDLTRLPKMSENEDELNQTIIDQNTLDNTASGHTSGLPLHQSTSSQSIPGPNADNIQLQILGKMNELFGHFQNLSKEVQAIGQRVDIIDHRPGPSRQPDAALSSRPLVNENRQTSAPPELLQVRGERPTSATSWNGPAVAEFAGANALAQKTFDLPRFSGKAAQWPIFISVYRQSTTAFGYSDLQNIFRLQKCLEGDARLAVESLLMSPENLENLLQTLELRFGRPEQLCNDQITRIREHPIIREHQYELLISFSSHVSNTVAFLNTDASRHVLTESSLLKEMVDKLPQPRKYEWLQHMETINERVTVHHFAQWLRTIAIRVSRMPMQSTAAPTPHPHRQSGNGRARDERRVLLNIAESCAVCEKSHNISECDIFRQQDLKKRWVTARRKSICFGCLQQGHSLRQCNNNQGGGYHEMLCKFNKQQTNYAEHLNYNNITPSYDENTHNNAGSHAKQVSRPGNPFSKPMPGKPIYTCREERDLPLLFRVVPVTLHGPDHSITTYALLDEGSSVTLIDTELANTLRLEGRSRQLNLKWINDHSRTTQSREVKLKISGASTGSSFDLNNVCTIDKLNLPMQSFSFSPNDVRHEHLRDLPITNYQQAMPKILIGLDNSHLGAARKTRISKHGGPIAALTPLGWVIYGRQTDGFGESTTLHCCEVNERIETIEKLIKDFHTTESFGVLQPGQTLESDEDTRARSLLQSTTVRVGERFQTGLLWRSDDVHLPDSFPMAMQRYSTIVKRMRRDKTFAQLYVHQIEDFINKGYARRLTPVEAATRDDRTWFLPHFGVQSVHKPGKLRIVFDAAATVNGSSLNSALLKGPDLNKPLVNILMEFRMRRVGVCADISEMFLQINMQPDDRRSQRFLWRSDGGPPDIYQMNVMTFGATCSPTSAQYVKNINAKNFEDEFPEASEAVQSLHYVDDFVASFDTESNAARITSEVVEIHRRGGFTLRGYVSNSRAVPEQLGAKPEDGSKATNMQLDSKENEKILGLR